MRTIVYNAIRTPDGTVLESRHVHDYRVYEDANGKTYMVDGGMDYLRRNVHLEAPYEELTLYIDDDFEKIREVFTWGTFGKEGDQPKKLVSLDTLGNAHIIAIIDTQHQISSTTRKLFMKELEYRMHNNIYIGESNYE